MDFVLTKEQEMARTLFRDFAENEVKPLAQEVDETERFPAETVEKMRKLGFLGIPQPKEHGGQGCDTLTYVPVSYTHLDVYKRQPFTVWSDDSSSAWYKDFPLDETMKELAWKHVDFCENCGGSCSPGKSKIIFGREFHRVCRTTMRFINPDLMELACIKKMVEDVYKRQGIHSPFVKE